MKKRLDTWSSMTGMKIVTLTRGGQVSIPAEFRRAWTSKRVMVREVDGGVMLRPMPDDPLEAAIGSLADKVKRKVSVEDAIRMYREDEIAAEERKYGPLP